MTNALRTSAPAANAPPANAHPSNALVRKLENFVRLSPEDREAAGRLWASRPARFRAKDDVIREGDRPRAVLFVVAGWACRYKFLEDGRRQIVSLFLPGDACDMNVFILREMDHFIGALTPLTVAQVGRHEFEAATIAQPRLMQALWWETLVNMAIQREWTLSLGQRSAFERIAHLLCEVVLRMRAAGLAEIGPEAGAGAGAEVGARGATCDFPLTQTVIADITGLSTVHVSRTFQALREERLLEIRDRTLLVPDLDALTAAALFNPNYLHLDREGRHLDANAAEPADAIDGPPG